MENIRQETYQAITKQLNDAMKGGAFLNLHALRKEVKNLTKRINALKKGAEMDFNMTLEKAEKVQNRIYELAGIRQAFQEKIDWLLREIE